MYTEIFKEVVSITHHDYSGCIDKEGWDDPTTYLQTIEKLERQGELTPVQFTDIQEDVDLKLALQLLQNEEW
ncbi:hypothetical protein [Bacillus sp. NPDC057893]|uniref:hypothetical protein n=1 Tax=Bacillus sp. NPDC057893 TaxID=3346273 RepID=UPI003672ECFE